MQQQQRQNERQAAEQRGRGERGERDDKPAR